MSGAWWGVAGLTTGLLIMLPLVRILLRRAEHRTREAERTARDSARLAELGSMTGGLAHEIKNPLSTVGLNAQLLAEAIRESELPIEQRDRLMRRIESLRREVDRLRDILTEFLRFAGRIRIDAQPTNLGELVEELADFYLPQCDQAGITLRTQLPEVPVTIDLDAGLIKQAVLNLMMNATQAMQGAAVSGQAAGELMLRVVPSEEAVSIHVIDTGPGIPAEKIEEIFRPYFSGRAGGSGLGLPIARRIVEEHGGRLVAHSEPGRGSDFEIRLPRAQAAG